ncbi:MAG: DEAD/DEAH box helicase [Blastocatellales bacterium]
MTQQNEQRNLAQLDAFSFANNLRDRLVEFSLDRNFVREPRLTEICRSLWAGPAESGGLVSELWVEGAFPAATSTETLDSLARQGLFDATLTNYLDHDNAVPRNRQLYTHQLEAIRQAQQLHNDHSRPALVVTAGTGAGKTESFLLPALNDLFANRGTGTGVKCIILYPMNALVNDQMDRLYQWLQDQNDVTLFHFTSETPEDHRAANDQDITEWNPCRKRTRKEARGLEDHKGQKLSPSDAAFGRAPDILITNYSMLEYMLCRPQDAVFFGDALRTVVLDEAHLYTGTLAAEITLLLRRLTERCGVRAEQLLHIATSATIGREGADGDEELRQFAATLFSKPPELVNVIRGQQRRIELAEVADPAHVPDCAMLAQEAWLTAATLTIDAEGKPQLATDADDCAHLATRLPRLVAAAAVNDAQRQAGDQPALLLHQSLSHAKIVHQASEILWERKRLPLRELASALWREDSENALRATITILQLGAAARRNIGDYPLLPHRLHLLARPTDGLVVCLNADCTGNENLKLPGLGDVLAGFSDHCLHCNSATLSLYRCANCGEVALAAQEANLRLLPVADDRYGKKRFFDWRGARESGRQILDVRTSEHAASGLALYQINSCPCCEAKGDDAWRPFVASAPLTLAILAETALADMPEFPTAHRKRLPARGRRLLAFSDSRQEAARLGPRLTLQHETQLVRAALARCAQQSSPSSAATIADIELDIADYEQKLQKRATQPEQRRRWEKKLDELRQELREHQAGGALEDWEAALAQQTILTDVIDPDTINSYEAKDWTERAEQIRELNFAAVKTRLRSLIGRELASPLRRAVSVETLGLLEVTYPGLEQIEAPNQLLGNLPAEVRAHFTVCWRDFLAALCDSLRSDGVITLGSPEEDRTWAFNRVFVGRWAAEEQARRNWVIRFVGVEADQRRRWFAAQVLKNCGLEEALIEEFSRDALRAAFRALCQHAGELPWLETDTRQTDGGQALALRLNFPSLGLRRPEQWFQSAQTRHIWPRSVFGCAPELGCNDLQPVTAKQLDSDPRYGRLRTELQRSPIFEIALWAEEHSAQLSPKQNRQLQELFKLGARNILSATTTLELGIDIGGLNAVLMGNVPPGKANYLQRAGRAGRRADGSSVVLTYARPRPFDRAVFFQFGDYLGRTLRSPRVLLDRQRIARRHCHALLLGKFFQDVYPPGAQVGAMRAFGSMGAFCGTAQPQKWTSGFDKPELRSPSADWQPPARTNWWRPEQNEPGLEPHFLDFLRWVSDAGEKQYRPILESLLQHTPLALIGDWRACINSMIEQFQDAVCDWREDYDELLQTWRDALSQRQANAIRYQLSALYDTTVIEALADRQFLPRYGFPIGLQKLQVIRPDEGSRDGERTRIREEDQFRLERPGLMALREYVPGSQLLVGGKLITSRGLRKHWTGLAIDNYVGLTGHFTECANKHFYYEISRPLGACPICGSAARQNEQPMLLPKHGFSSAAWDPPRRSTDVERIGSVERATICFGNQANEVETHAHFAGVNGLAARYREAGELLVYNSGAIWEEDDNDTLKLVARGRGFAVCLKCGYADAEVKTGEGRQNLPSGFATHAPLTAAKEHYVCWQPNEGAPVLRNRTLAARETTDILLLTFEGSLSLLAKEEAIIRTLAQALQIAGAQLLELDTRELGVMLTGVGCQANEWGAVIYDNVPGGAGHVRELLGMGRQWMEEAQKILFRSEEHHQRCELACLDCLLTFDAQEAMSQGLLKRRETYEVLKKLLSGTPLSLPEPQKILVEELADSAIRASNVERIKRNQQRLRQR